MLYTNTMLKELIDSRGLTQTSAAKLCGVPLSDMKRYVYGAKKIPRFVWRILIDTPEASKPEEVNFKSWLIHMGLTHQAAAAALGYSVSTIANYAASRTKAPPKLTRQCLAMKYARAEYLAHHTQDKQSL